MPRNAKTNGSDVLKYYQTFEPISKSVDLERANKKVLSEHGYPRRPNKHIHPRLFKLWDRLVVNRPEYVKAELQIGDIVGKRNRIMQKGTEFRPISWGGVGVRTEDVNIPLGQPLFVFGEWVVPAIYPVAGQSNSTQIVGFWVGIDGWQGTQILQAGIAASITGNSVEYWAWTEWYTEEFMDPSVIVQNFPIKQGDLVSFLVCAQTLEYGQVTILNSTTNQMTSVGIQGRPGMHLDGTSAEWVVEGITEDLPNYFAWTFSDSIAGSLTGGLLELQPHGLTRDIFGDDGRYVTESHIVSPVTGVVLWKGLA